MSAAVEQYVMTESEAHKVTEDIRHNAKSFAEYHDRLMAAVERARSGSAHIALGYRSWTEYLSEVMGEEPMRLARGDRKDAARMLSSEGMSTRAIAPIVGASREQVRRDLRSPDTNVSPAPAPAFVDAATGEIHDECTSDAPAPPVTGMDGKTYTRPEPTQPAEPTKPRRRPLPDAFFDAAYDLDKNIERIQRLTEDDRFPANKEQVARKHANDLSRIADVLADVLRHFNN